MSAKQRWAVVVIYAVAMAWVESAVVFYVRTMIDRIEPYQPEPLPLIGALGPVELARELATMIMLATVGLLAGRTWRSRLGYSVLAFGVWDILYYVFLKIMCGWPHSAFDWDILFLIPLPWWGPVAAPMAIAALFILWGTVASQVDEANPVRLPHWPTRFAAGLGALIALYTFMADTLRVATQGVEVVRNVLPAKFNWALFVVGLALMALPVLRRGEALRSLLTRRLAKSVLPSAQ
jgi:hypothetical protein